MVFIFSDVMFRDTYGTDNLCMETQYPFGLSYRYKTGIISRYQVIDMRIFSAPARTGFGLPWDTGYGFNGIRDIYGL